MAILKILSQKKGNWKPCKAASSPGCSVHFTVLGQSSHTTGERLLHQRFDLLPDVCLALGHRVIAFHDHSDRNARPLLLLELLNYCDYISPRIGQLHYFIPPPIFHSETVFTRIQCRRYEATSRQLPRTWCFQTRQADKSGALRLRQTPELDELAPTPSVEWNIRMSKMFFLTCCERTMEWIFIPSQSRSWHRFCWGTKHRKQVKSSCMITYRLLWIAQIAHLDAQCLYGVWCLGRMDRLKALSARDATSLEFGSKSRNSYESPKIACDYWWFQETYQMEG